MINCGPYPSIESYYSFDKTYKKKSQLTRLRFFIIYKRYYIICPYFHGRYCVIHPSLEVLARFAVVHYFAIAYYQPLLPRITITSRTRRCMNTGSILQPRKIQLKPWLWIIAISVPSLRAITEIFPPFFQAKRRLMRGNQISMMRALCLLDIWRL